MATPGANLDYSNPNRVWRVILTKMGIRVNGGTGFPMQTPDATGTSFPRAIAICEKAGVPTTNAEADAPSGVGDLCWDSTNSDVYRSTAYTNTTTHTWAKIVD